MSSTNRSNARDNHVSDFYVTPVEQITIFLRDFVKAEPNFYKGIILDPCAGGDAQHPMSYPTALKVPVFTMDIREDSLAAVKGDYLNTDLDYTPDLIITNPPFNIAIDIIEKALRDVRDGGFVIMLLRLNFFGGQLRKKFWDQNMPKYCYIHHKRMSFTDDNKTDSVEYAHFVWQKGHSPEFTQVKVI